MAKSVLDAKVKQLNAEIARLTDIRNYLLDGEADGTTPPAEPKPKRGRKPKGLPKEEPGL